MRKDVIPTCVFMAFDTSTYFKYVHTYMGEIKNPNGS